MNERFETMLAWLTQLPFLVNQKVSPPLPASSDASFRRYFRIQVTNQEGAENTYIIMDAPVEVEDCEPFIRISKQLRNIGLNVPKVLAQNLEQGFLLLTDLGNQTYLSAMESASESEVDRLYQSALTALVTLQSKGQKLAPTLPNYDASLLDNEMNLFSDWLVGTHLNITLDQVEQQRWKTTKELLQRSALAQPKVYVHRDYHSRNLMVTQQNVPGILDFQDAVQGALTYDAVSLLRDCYIAWPEDQIVEWQRAYFLQLCAVNLAHKSDWLAFQKSMDLMGVQRHLKASGIFARLNHRDGKENYLKDIPLTLSYMVTVGSKYSELNDLVRLIENKILPKMSDLK
ncbi:Phosphotransferase involved in threonylcarbamoyladenosine t(6)A37 formation in tRNA [hydrothermal vent metagenome]|uniref:Phosphotransferase involved in threonylcarbamoyladenosine t(6)A37 formation in tRNA n=1 Tax=hydrothermal vent metagenome TaxID=652676 RepID=A0A3B0W610_9ZZZZ